MSDPLRRYKYVRNRILIPAARILSPQFNAVYLHFTGAHIELMRNLLDYANRSTTFVDSYEDNYYVTPDDDDLDTIFSIVADLEEILMTSVLGFYDAYVCVRDKKPQDTDGGTFMAGAWRTRDITDKHADAAGICSISANQITLAPGTYRTLVSCPVLQVNRCQARLYNITAASELLVGQSMFNDVANKGSTPSIIVGRFVLGVESVLEVQHRGYTDMFMIGFGIKTNFTDEIYTTAEFWREA